MSKKYNPRKSLSSILPDEPDEELDMINDLEDFDSEEQIEKVLEGNEYFYSKFLEFINDEELFKELLEFADDAGADISRMTVSTELTVEELEFIGKKICKNFIRSLDEQPDWFIEIVN
ncbi:MAG: hypothetical protein AABY32_02575 [Nanoarchaeota archaeon]